MGSLPNPKEEGFRQIRKHFVRRIAIQPLILRTTVLLEATFCGILNQSSSGKHVIESVIIALVSFLIDQPQFKPREFLDHLLISHLPNMNDRFSRFESWMLKCHSHYLTLPMPWLLILSTAVCKVLSLANSFRNPRTAGRISVIHSFRQCVNPFYDHPATSL
jgi:hypothetical protein